MSGGREYRIGITADDGSFAPGLDKVAKALRRFEEGPVRKMNTQLGEATQLSRLDQWEKAFTKVGREVRGIGDELFNMLPSLGVMTRIGTGAGAVMAAGSMTFGFAQQGRTLQQWSTLLGVSIDRLQTLVGAAAQKGIDQDTFLNSLSSLQRSLSDARIGRNNDLLAAARFLGVRISTNLNEPLNLPARLAEIASAIARQPLAEGKVEAATRLQAMPLFQLLQDGAPGLRQLEQSVPRIGVMSEEASRQGDALAASLDRLGLAAKGAANKIGERMNVKGGVDGLTDFLNFWSMSPGFADKLSVLSRPSAAPAAPSTGGVPWYKQKPLSQMSSEELARAGRDARSQDGRVIIQLKVEKDPGMRIRAIAQDEGPVQTEVFMPPDGP